MMSLDAMHNILSPSDGYGAEVDGLRKAFLTLFDLISQNSYMWLILLFTEFSIFSPLFQHMILFLLFV